MMFTDIIILFNSILYSYPRSGAVQLLLEDLVIGFILIVKFKSFSIVQCYTGQLSAVISIISKLIISEKIGLRVTDYNQYDEVHTR